MPKVVQFSTVHPPNDIRVFHRECRTLAAAGYDVTYVVPHERDEIVDGVQIRAVPPPKTRIDRAFRSAWRVLLRALKEDGAVYHFHDPELIPFGLLLKLLGRRVVYDAHEDTPREVLNKDYIPVFLRHTVAMLTEFMEVAGMLAFDAIVSATPAIGKRFPKRKNCIVQNFPIEEEYVLDESVPYQRRPNHLLYVGALTLLRGPREMLQVLTMLPEELGARLVLAGKFVPQEVELEARQWPGWSKVDFLGWRPRKELSRELGRARIGMAVFSHAPNYSESQPAKLFEYMSAGLPVVASDFPHWRQFVADTKCGILVDSTNVRAITDAVAWLLRNPEEAEAMGKRGQAAVRERFNWNVEARTLLELYRHLTHSDLGQVES